jgi:enoyl-[acyl-carrier protein] reductase I
LPGAARSWLEKWGADIVATCLNDKARKYVEPLTQPLTQPLGIELLNCDVEESGAVESLVDTALQSLGHFDFVIHSIAWAPIEDLHGRTIDSSSIGFARVMEVSCHSFATLSKACTPHMTAGGSLLAMTYLGADEAVPHYGLMGPVKAALESLVRYMAMELGPNNIRVHAVSPGPIPTRAASGIGSFDELMQSAIRKAPLGRLVTLREVAQLCVFLCSGARHAISRGWDCIPQTGFAFHSCGAHRRHADCDRNSQG